MTMRRRSLFQGSDLGLTTRGQYTSSGDIVLSETANLDHRWEILDENGDVAIFEDAAGTNSATVDGNDVRRWNNYLTSNARYWLKDTANFPELNIESALSGVQFDRTNNEIMTFDSSSWNPTTGDWTIYARMKLVDDTLQQYMFGFEGNGNRRIRLVTSTTLEVTNDGTVATITISETLGTDWFNLAIERDDDTVTLYKNETSIGSATGYSGDSFAWSLLAHRSAIANTFGGQMRIVFFYSQTHNNGQRKKINKYMDQF